MSALEADRIMFLPLSRDVELEGAAFRVLEDFDSAVAQVQGRLHSDGFVYPGLEPPRTWHSGSPDAINTPGSVRWNVELLSDRPAHLHKLPASHQLELYVQPIAPDFRASDGAFLLHLAAYLYGIRLQFHDWWFDGRVPMKTTHHAFIRIDAEREFLSRSFREWRACEEPERRLLTNMLYMHSRSPSHQWDWEHFNVNYTVFDAIYRLAVRLYGLPESKAHKDRLYSVCKQFGVNVEADNLEKIYELRNPLIHEGWWLNQPPGTKIPNEYWYQVQNLRKLNQRLIPSLFGFDSKYVSSTWSSFSLMTFDPPHA